MDTVRPALQLSHHATLIRGDRARALDMVADALGIAFQTTADPDIAYIESESLTIDDVRVLSMRALQKPVSKDHMTFIVVAHAINTEAQHALLKLTEDPPVTARFIFILPFSAPLLPTLRSRFNIIVCDEPLAHESQKETLAKELKEIVRMTKDKDEAGMEHALRDAEKRAHKNPSTRGAAATLLARRYIEARGASPKMLLEHLAIAERE